MNGASCWDTGFSPNPAVLYIFLITKAPEEEEESEVRKKGRERYFSSRVITLWPCDLKMLKKKAHFLLLLLLFSALGFSPSSFFFFLFSYIYMSRYVCTSHCSAAFCIFSNDEKVLRLDLYSRLLFYSRKKKQMLAVQTASTTVQSIEIELSD